ncbi:unnamed protein product [Amoebophrya sp. A120]|nr:unnamed protein product [Amoebophrya sp. A120]|eukprot:GSA120T00022040001.1
MVPFWVLYMDRPCEIEQEGTAPGQQVPAAPSDVEAKLPSVAIGVRVCQFLLARYCPSNCKKQKQHDLASLEPSRARGSMVVVHCSFQHFAAAPSLEIEPTVVPECPRDRVGHRLRKIPGTPSTAPTPVGFVFCGQVGIANDDDQYQKYEDIYDLSSSHEDTFSCLWKTRCENEVVEENVEDEIK